MSETLDLSLYATPAGNGTFGMELAIDGIACGACIARVEGAVKQVPGVTEARLNFTNRRLPCRLGRWRGKACRNSAGA